MKRGTEHQGVQTREKGGGSASGSKQFSTPAGFGSLPPSFLPVERGWFGTGSPFKFDISHGNTQLNIELGSRDPDPIPYTLRELAERTPS